MTATDDQLLSDAVQGDRKALDQLFIRHDATVRRRLKNQIDSRWRHLLTEDDVMQQTCLDAAVFIGDFEPRGIEAFVGWLTNLARRNLIDAIRELQAEKRGGNRVRTAVDMAPSDVSYADLFERIGGSVTSPSQAAMAGEAKLALEAALQQIPDAYLRVIRLYDLFGQAAEDVARDCDCSVGAMHMRRSRGLAMLHKILRAQSQFKN